MVKIKIGNMFIAIGHFSPNRAKKIVESRGYKISNDYYLGWEHDETNPIHKAE